MRKVIGLLVVLTVAVSAFSQRLNRLNLNYDNSYDYNFNPALGNGNLMTVGIEIIPGFDQKNGLFGIIGDNSRILNFGAYFSTSINSCSWENKRISLDTAIGIADLNLKTAGLIAVVKLPGLDNIGNLLIVLKTGPSFFQRKAQSQMLYNFYTDSIFTGSALKNYTEEIKNFNWDLDLKIFRFSPKADWAFRNSLEIKYSAILSSSDKLYTDSILTNSLSDKGGYLSVVGETNIVDLNISNTMGFDPRVQIGCIRGGRENFGVKSNTQLQPLLGVSLSLVPRINQGNDNLDDAVKVGYRWYGGSGNSGQIYISANLFSLGRLF